MGADWERGFAHEHTVLPKFIDDVDHWRLQKAGVEVWPLHNQTTSLLHCLPRHLGISLRARKRA